MQINHTRQSAAKKRRSAVNESQRGSNRITRLLVCSLAALGRHHTSDAEKPTASCLLELPARHVRAVFESTSSAPRDQQQALLKCRLIQAIFGINYLSGDVRRLERE